MGRGAGVVREAVANLAASRAPNPLPVRRAVMELVDSLNDGESIAAAEPLMSRGLSPGEHHLLSVTTLAVLIGRALGLSDAAQSDLGVAAMLHDVGYTIAPDKTGHLVAGARQLMKQRGFHEAKIRRLLVVLDHHAAYQNPARRDDERAHPPILFARVIRIADDYETLTSRRPGQLPPLSPTMALASMWAARGTEYDPELLALFVQQLGMFPPGTLLELSDGRWAISVSGARDADRFRHPLVRVVRDADGGERQADEELDLFLLKGKVAIRKVLDPEGKQLNVGEVLERAPTHT
jgi:hypothetical protein